MPTEIRPSIRLDTSLRLDIGLLSLVVLLVSVSSSGCFGPTRAEVEPLSRDPTRDAPGGELYHGAGHLDLRALVQAAE